ncbi:MAG: hypothetical protein P8Z70_07230 [Desulfuromonadales bacterium]
MLKALKVAILVIPLLMLTFPVHAEEVSKDQMKGLDEQVQDIKTDVLGIAVELNQLEEKLLYPSNTTESWSLLTSIPSRSSRPCGRGACSESTPGISEPESMT